MSKNQLKKELSTFTCEQLVEVILSAYSSSKEAKEYFEFFLNPDLDALFEKKSEAIYKELSRESRRRCKGRISIIRNHIKSFANFGAPPEEQARLILLAISLIMVQESFSHIPDALINGVAKFVREYLELANQHGFSARAIEQLDHAIEKSGRPRFRNYVRQCAEKAIAELSSKL